MHFGTQTHSQAHPRPQEGRSASFGLRLLLLRHLHQDPPPACPLHHSRQEQPCVPRCYGLSARETISAKSRTPTTKPPSPSGSSSFIETVFAVAAWSPLSWTPFCFLLQNWPASITCAGTSKPSIAILSTPCGATSWHCQTPTSFHQELLVHMIALCLIRIAMLEASRLANVSVGQLSFARALTETRLFFKLLTLDRRRAPVAFHLGHHLCSAVHDTACKFKPNRQFPRDRQQYRRKSRGLERHRPGRKRKTTSMLPLEPEPLNKPETLKDSKGSLFLLS